MNVYTIISILAIVTLLILIVYHVYRIFKLVFYKKVENFKFGESKCLFDTSLPNLQLENSLDCTNKCLKYEDERKLYKDCTFKLCSDICNKCEKAKDKGEQARCPWDKLAYYQTYEYNSGTLVAPRINVVTFNGYIKVSFVKPNKFVSGYIYYLTQSYKRHEGITLGKFPNGECIICEKIIKDLDEDTMYSIGVRSYRKDDEVMDVAYSPMSNIVNFKPQIKMTSKAYAISTPISEFDENLSFCPGS